VDRWIVSRLGGDPAAALGLDLADATDLGRWWVAACLLSGGGSEARAQAAFQGLTARRLDTPSALAAASAEPVTRILEEARLPKAALRAAALIRSCRGLVERHAGSLSALAAGADGLDDLGARLAALGRGIGSAAVLCFLRPLRGLWPAAADLPLSPAAEAAAAHLGLAWNGDLDLEAALDRLGRRACLRARSDRCPLGSACPARS
jgi:hypothetical protein